MKAKKSYLNSLKFRRKKVSMPNKTEQRPSSTVTHLISNLVLKACLFLTAHIYKIFSSYLCHDMDTKIPNFQLSLLPQSKEQMKL